MTQPNPADAGQQQQQKRYRPGQVVSFRFTDVLSGLEVVGHGLVLRVLDELAHLAVLGAGGHVQTDVENLTAAKVEDVPNPLPAPEPAEGSAS